MKQAENDLAGVVVLRFFVVKKYLMYGLAT